MKMKTFAIDIEGNVVDLTFRNEDEADAAFGDVMKGGLMSGKVVDNDGKSVLVDVSYGYSRNRADLDGVRKNPMRV